MVNDRYNGNKAISVLIEECSKIMKNDHFDIVDEKVSKYLDEQTNNTLIKAIILKWLSNKNQIKSESKATESTNKEEVDNFNI